MLIPFIRASAPFVVDAINLAPRTHPSVGQAHWARGQQPGTLIHSTKVRSVGLGTRLNEADVWKIEYVTRDGHDHPLTATGAAFRSRVPWVGTGSRPTIALAPSTQGVAPRCDPSYSCTVGVSVRFHPFDVIASYEQPVINYLIALGCNVVLTDYPRSPDGNVQLYCDHLASARALIDAIRASISLGISPDNLGLWGFSQGAGTIGAWLEQPEYAAELSPRAAVVGAPPARLPDVLNHVDGALPSAVILYYVGGLMASDHTVAEEVSPLLSDDGARALAFGASVCAPGAVATFRYARTENLTTIGLPLGEILDRFPQASAAVKRVELGHRKPLDIPILLWGSRNDDIIPYSLVKGLAERWGVDLRTYYLPQLPGRTGANHFLPYFQHATRNAQWLAGNLGR